MAADRSLIAAAAITALAGAMWFLLSGPERARPAPDPAAPNIVVVMTDDQNAGTVNRRTMPHTARLLKHGGTNFQQSVVTTPQCCPSRATFFSGQYGHNNGVLSNSDGYPGLRDRENLLPGWLQQAGYTTAHVGRFMKDYAKADGVGDAAEPPPGWDEWAGMQGVRYFDYAISHDGVRAHYGDKPSDYSTTVFTREAVGIVREHAPRAAPLFLSVAYVAPHKERRTKRNSYCDGSIAPAPRDRHLFADEPLPEKDSIGEPDIEDKPDFIRTGKQLDDKRAKTVRAYRCGLAALREVDRGVKRIYDAFRAAGELDNTVFVFTSDNGRFNGEHGLPGGKSFPYEESIKVPLLVRLPKPIRGEQGRQRVSKLVANIDLAPTILDLARARPCLSPDRCRLLDGRSLVNLLTGRASAWPRDRAILIELREPPDQGQVRLPCSYVGVRTKSDFFVRYTAVRDAATGTCLPAETIEYYDLAQDPEQLENRASDESAADRRAFLAARLQRLADCRGLPGRNLPVGAQPCD
jgi:arylsulfatase A-like enzyme